MPVHDWTRVSDGTFHDFHYSWVLEIKRALKRGLLPDGYYVMAEQFGGDLGAPDVLTLQAGFASRIHFVPWGDRSASIGNRSAAQKSIREAKPPKPSG